MIQTAILLHRLKEFDFRSEESERAQDLPHRYFLHVLYAVG